MKYSLVLLLNFGIFTTTISGQTLHREIERIIIHDTDIKYDLTPGFVIGIIDGDSTYIESFGGRADDRSIPLTRFDVFELGSVTKLWTACLVDIAIAEGKLSIDALVNKFILLPFQNPRLTELTVGDLLHHQSPLPRRPLGFGKKEVDPQNPYAQYTKSDLLEAYSHVVDRGKEPVYSHMNYALLELILEDVYKMRYERLLKEKIFEPLNMQQSKVYIGEGIDQVSSGLDRSGTVTPPWSFSSFAGSEGGKSSLEDMLKFASAHFKTDEFGIMLRDNFDGRYPSFGEDLFVSMGWQIVDVNRRINAAIHTGHTDGHAVFIGLVPRTETAVIVLSNSTFGTRDLGMLILRMINDNWKRKNN